MNKLELHELEYGKIFRRLMKLESNIKHRLKSSIISNCHSKCYANFSQFFQSKHISKHYYVRKNAITKFDLILKKNIAEKEKVCMMIDELYISHLISFVLNHRECRKPYLCNAVFIEPPDYKKLNYHKNKIRDLRNAISHFNFEDFEINRKEYLQALCVFEYYFDEYRSTIEEFISKNNKKTVAKALRIINIIKPELIECTSKNNPYNWDIDRVLVDFFDEIYICFGKDCKKLPSPWTIVREKFLLKEKMNKSTLQ